jgi:hypothetical protein
VVYTAQSQSLAVLEVLVHLDSPELLKKYLLFEVVIDSSCVRELDLSNLPRNWKANPAPARVQAMGDDWVAGGNSAVLRVPSTLVPGESTFLLNPRHPDFRKLRIGNSGFAIGVDRSQRPFRGFLPRENHSSRPLRDHGNCETAQATPVPVRPPFRPTVRADRPSPYECSERDRKR